MRSAGPKVAVSLCVILTATVSLAQSLGELARKERERRSQLTQHAREITNEDLKRDRILSPPSEQTSTATTTTATPQPQPNAAAEQHVVLPANMPPWSVAKQPGFSLGEYARALRQRRQAREQQDAAIHVPQPAGRVPQRASSPATTATTDASVPPAKRVASSLTAQPDRIERKTTQHDDPAPAPIRVARGDSLWRLARLHLGEGRLWPLLWEANPEVRNPDQLKIGQQLRVPARDLNFAGARNSRTLATIRRALERRAQGPQITSSSPSTVSRVSSAQESELTLHAPILPAQARLWPVGAAIGKPAK